MLSNLTPQVSMLCIMLHFFFRNTHFLLVFNDFSNFNAVICIICSLQIDGSTLRTICMQHGPLLTFHLGLTQGSALIRYSTRQEAAKAQSALHM